MREDIAVYCLDGMSFWGGVAASLLDCRLYQQVPLAKHYDKVLVIGMYDAPMYATTLDHTRWAKQRVIMWCGTDVQFLPYDSNLVLPEAVHLCDSEALREELWDKGIEATVVPWPAPHHFDVTPLPEQKAVAFYMGSDPEKYGWSVLRAALEVMEHDYPELTVYTYGANEMPPEKLAEVVALSNVYVRLTEHDGGAMSAKEYLEAGRRVVCTADLEYASRVKHDDVVAVVSALRKALKATEPDYEAAAYWHAQNSVERWKEQVDGLV